MERLIADEHWPTKQQQRLLAVAYLMTTDQARSYFAADKLDKAIDSANKALAIKPEYVPALLVVADADFEKANFAGAAEMYGRALRLDPKQDQVTVLYASALSASLPAREALAKYTEMADAVLQLRERAWFSEEQSGLTLMTGDVSAPHALAQELESSDAEAAPILLGRLGWWYYRFGDIATAGDIIGRAVEQRPQVTWLSAKLAWTLIAQKKYESAQQRLRSIESPQDDRTRAEIEMGIAVSSWNEGQPDPAISNFRGAVGKRAAWLNQQWVSELYGPEVSGTIQEIHAQSERQKRTQRATR